MHDLQRFIDGFQRFQQQYFGHDRALYSDLLQGQRPSTLLIGCCDSRVDPALLLGCDPGDIFTVRNVANLVPPFDPAQHIAGVTSAVQFAVAQLGVARVIVLGHAQCGGIRALLEERLSGSDETDFITRWMQIVAPARDEIERRMPEADAGERRRACEMAAILVSLRNLETFPWVQRRVAEGVLTLHGWYFDLEAGTLLAYSPRADGFLPLVASRDMEQE
ncbi:carbonic anhydrase [Andreprevotia lacus DSM 23236]|jgi:carbonic anhydrase|uniref:Carbonic anhydrase n=1 Tax=Andreprevotia lacus DSM 23236 TaxID=1121001 RepID=A0A1W1XY59_9NEIS|nr:carbonic anhydrase [Andreprevotia lacus]SMC28438.1 carbonic anhydrase [Andreprevotia lacus DSM 23236]